MPKTHRKAAHDALGPFGQRAPRCSSCSRRSRRCSRSPPARSSCHPPPRCTGSPSRFTHLVSKDKLAEYQKLVSKHMSLWKAVVLCLAVPSEVPGYLLGSLHYSFWKFLAAISIAEGIYAIGIVIAGKSLIDANPAVLAGAVAIMVAIAVGAGFILRRRRKRK